MTHAPSQGATVEAVVPATVGDYFSLLKPRVMSLVVFTGFVGLYLAPGSIHPFIGAVAVLCIALGAGASGAINMWYERDVDAVMERTKNRPLPAGRVNPQDALEFAVVMAAASVYIMALVVNFAAAALLLSAILFYVFIYTIWLKRNTPQNIVIGGAAGAFPPMIGWAAVTGSVSVESALLFLIIFMWTPPHFWALALYRNEDYRRAGIPMLPVVAGGFETRRQMLLYTSLLLPITIMPWFFGMMGYVYLGGALLLGAGFMRHMIRVYTTSCPKTAMRMFGYSVAYLFLLFVFMLLDKVVAYAV